MTVDYDNFAKSFADSRKNMKWAELEYFFSYINQGSILDIGCGSGRLVEQYNEYFGNLPKEYLGVDLSRGLLDEAKKNHPEMDFLQGNMLDIIRVTEGKLFAHVFLIASFHHLQTIEERELFLRNLFLILEAGAKVYMTNWALNSTVNRDKYIESRILSSENQFGSTDYNILFGDNERYYHCFSLDELEFLAKKVGFTVLENKLFEGERNFITILEK